MKTTVTVLTLSATLALTTAAMAEPFNDRGQQFKTTVESEADAVRSTVTITNSEFKNRGVDYISDAPAGSPAQEPTLSLEDKEAYRWNG